MIFVTLKIFINLYEVWSIEKRLEAVMLSLFNEFKH